MNLELYTREQVSDMLSAYESEPYISEQIARYAPYSEPPLICSVDGCDEPPLCCHCTQHYNELLEKNEELAEELGRKEIIEDHIIEPSV